MILRLNFYGVACRIDCPPELGEALRKDFAYFADSAAESVPAVTFSFRRDTPPFGKMPFVPIPFRYADWTARDRGDLRYVDYGKKALGIYDYRREAGEIYSEDGNLLHELAYLMVLSRTGELLDRKGLHRVHAMGVEVDGQGVLCLLPQGGGKTTLCLELLKAEGVRLFSDDTPLINAQGDILPFPSRIGVCAPSALDVPAAYLSEFKRRRYGPKTLIDVEYYRDRIAPACAKPDIVLIGSRSRLNAPRLERTGKTGAVVPLMQNCVIGIGLPQVVEYFVRFNAGDIAGKMRIALARCRASREVARRAEVYRFELGTDIRGNADCLLALLRGRARSMAA